MRKLLFLLAALLFVSVNQSSAQAFRWVRGGGGGSPNGTGSDAELVLYMTSDQNGNIYGVARTMGLTTQLDTFYRILQYGANTVQLVLFSYNCGGQLRWAKLIESNGQAYCNGLVYDNGKIFLSGNMHGTDKRVGADTVFGNSFNNVAYVMSYDTSGTYKWLKFVGPDVINNSTLTGRKEGALAVDGLGQLHFFKYIRTGVQVTPSVNTQYGVYDLTYSAQGQLLSAVRLDLDSTWAVTHAAIDKPTGKVYVRASRNLDLVPGSNISALAAFGVGRNRLWMDTTTTLNYSNFTALAMGPQKQLYATCAGTDSFIYRGQKVYSVFSPSNVFVVMKLDTNGAPVWMKPFSVTATANFLSVYCGTNGRVTAGGLYGGQFIQGSDTLKTPTGQGQNGMFVTLDPSGNLVHFKQLQGTGFYDRVSVVAGTNTGNIYLGGGFANNIWADTLTPLGSQGGGSTDYFVMKYGDNCTPCSMPGSFYTYSVDTAHKKITCTYTGTVPVDSVRWRFGDGQKGSTNPITHTYSDTGTYRVCVYAYNSCGVDSFCQSIRIPPTVGIGTLAGVFGDVMVYPNPTRDLLWIEHAEPGMKASLLSISGSLIGEWSLHQKTEKIDLSAVPVGSYLLQLRAADGRRAGMVVIRQ